MRRETAATGCRFFYVTQANKLQFGSRHLDLDQPAVMGILNVTPDSFSDGGSFTDHDLALRHAESMLSAGASIIDVGGESTRPGAMPVSEQQEIDRVLPVISAIVDRLDVIVSVDTSKAGVMRAAVAAGANLINDVYALRQDGALQAAASLDAAVCLMHMQGSPATMQKNPRYENVAGDIAEFLKGRIAACTAAGLAQERLLVDPGFGFGKNDKDNLELLHRLDEFRRLGRPILVGLSRKRTLGNLTGKSIEQRLSAGVAAAVLAVERGASIIRTHDVAETVAALLVAQAVMKAGSHKVVMANG
ncbi:MAG: dihydropteroate synthase [Gammaproteobacteria bacterium]|nr:dihydropteroate synthase [Gammaproteobacteria bacterium]